MKLSTLLLPKWVGPQPLKRFGETDPLKAGKPLSKQKGKPQMILRLYIRAIAMLRFGIEKLQEIGLLVRGEITNQSLVCLRKWSGQI